MNEVEDIKINVNITQQETNYTFGGYDYNTDDVTLNSTTKTTSRNVTGKFGKGKGSLKIGGTKDAAGDHFRNETWAALKMLTVDDLTHKNWDVRIKKRNEGSKPVGTALIRGILDGDFGVTLTNDVSGTNYNLTNQGHTVANNWSSAQNGTGSGSTIYISPILQSSLFMQDGTKEMVPYFIALGHELIPADRSRLGITNLKRIEPWDSKIKTIEELHTFIRENLLRDEHLLKHRYIGNN